MFSKTLIMGIFFPEVLTTDRGKEREKKNTVGDYGRQGRTLEMQSWEMDT
jgi:hypothetical protein